MIAHLRGRLISKHPNQAIVEAGGVGYDVTISVPTFSELPALNVEVSFFIHTHVREDALALFGFLSAGEKQLLEKLLSVSGIGPKLAITILSGMPAEGMVLELRDKLDAFGVPADAITSASPVEEDVISALVNLGYPRPMAERALAKLGDVSGQSFDSLFRKAMAALAK